MSPVRIALLLNLQTGYCRRAVRGIVAFGAELDWVVEVFAASNSSLRQLATWRPDGIIAHVLDPEIGKEVEELGVPTVNISSSVPDLSFPTIDSDHEKLGGMAADYFWNLGMRNFAFFGAADFGHSRDRETGFVRYLEEKNQTVATHYSGYTLRPPHQPDMDLAHEEAARWITGLPKPTAVFCSDDEHARQLSTLCRLNKIDVPGDLALLGVDNDETLCLLGSPPLSSVDNPAEEIGYLAARTLDTMLETRGTSPPDQFVEPLRVIERESTDKFAVSDAEVRRALKFIFTSARRPDLCIDQVADASGLSRRSLERRFSSVLGLSVLNAIHRARVSIAKDLLRESALSVEQIAEQCGFSDHRRLGLVFRSLTGMTATEFRKFYEFDRQARG